MAEKSTVARLCVFCYNAVESMIDFEKELNSEQLEVVKNGDGPCLVLAGAGSGKTRAITYRVAYLLERGIKPDSILLMTFTNKAAREMVNRVQALTAGSLEGGLPWSGTFHHIAYRLIKRYGALLGYENNFSILDSEDAKDLMKLCIKDEGIDRKEKRFPSPSVVSGIISYASNAERALADVLEHERPKWFEYEETLSRIAGRYAARKRQSNAMDFDDLLTNLKTLLLAHENVRDTLCRQFEYVLVDEYQDTNKVQADIVDVLAGGRSNILVVGDDAQSIYSFRAADIENILRFEKKYPDAKVFRLETNYRSTPEILAVANDVIARNTRQYEKVLRAVRESFARPEVHAYMDAREEAQGIAERISELRGEGVPLSHIAVLFRAAFHSQALEMELTSRDIPYEYRGGVRFFERGHIKDVLAYLRIFANSRDTAAWSRVLNMQAGIGPSSARTITEAVLRGGTDRDFSYLSSFLTARAQLGWSDFMSVWSNIMKSDGSPAGLIRAVLDSKYIDYLENEYPDYRERTQDIEQLALFAERSEDLSLFLAEAGLQESHSRPSADGRGNEKRLVLSTVHQAKGLEWEAVFIMNLSAGQFPNERAVREDNGLEEERRLFYVAVTRAKKYLHLSYPLAVGFGALGGPSPFLEEIGREYMDKPALGGSTVFTDPSDDVDGIEYVPFEGDEYAAPRRSFLMDV